MTTARHAEGTWVDIVPPAPPAVGADPTLLLVVLLLLGLLLAGVLYWRRPRPRARRRLRRLDRALRRARLEPKQAGFEIRHCLREGLGQRHLEALRLEDALQAEWQAYLARLRHCCFAASPPTRVELDALIRQARRWLRVRAEAA